MTGEDDRDKIGEALYMKVEKFHPQYAGKITGMMLDSLEDRELRKVMDDEPLLRVKVEQALTVLKSEESPTPRKTEENGNGSNGNGSKKDKEYKDKIKELQAELGEAERWAEDMQGEWDAKEAEWKKAEEGRVKDSEKLMKRLSAAEARAEAAAKTPTNGADKVEVLKAKVTEAEERLKASESEKADVDKKLTLTEDRLKEASTKAKGSDEEVTKLKTELAAKGASVKGGESNEEVSKLKAELAAKTATLKDEEAKGATLKKELAAKEQELQRTNTAAKAKSEDGINGKAHPTKELDALKSQLTKAEEELVNARSASSTSEEKEREAREELEKQKTSLEKAQMQIEGYKLQLKAPKDAAKTGKADTPEFLQKKLNIAQAEIAALKAEAEKQMPPVSARGAGSDPVTPRVKAAQEVKPTKEVKAKEVKPVPPIMTKPVKETVEAEEEEEEEEEAPTPAQTPRDVHAKASPAASKVPDAKNKAQPTSAGKASKKKGASASDTPVTLSKKRKSSEFPLSGTHVVAGCLVVVVMIQLGLFVYEGWFGDELSVQ